MPNSSNRNFRLSDAMAFIVATALASAATRHEWMDYFKEFGPVGEVDRAFLELMLKARNFLYLASYFTGCWSLTCLVLGLRRPRKSLQFVFRKPGMVACLVTAVVLGIRMVNIVVAFSVEYTCFAKMSFQYYIKIDEFSTYVPSEVGCAIAAAWVVQRAVGRWRPEACWIDRAGRAFGCLWLLTIPFSGFTWS